MSSLFETPNLSDHIIVFKKADPIKKTGELSITMRALFDLFAVDMGYIPIKEKSAILCQHANEVPAICPCQEDCYCKNHTCKNRKEKK